MLDRYRVALYLFGVAAVLIWVAGGPRVPQAIPMLLCALAAMSELIGRTRRMRAAGQAVEKAWWLDPTYLALVFAAAGAIGVALYMLFS